MLNSPAAETNKQLWCLSRSAAESKRLTTNERRHCSRDESHTWAGVFTTGLVKAQPVLVLEVKFGTRQGGRSRAGSKVAAAGPTWTRRLFYGSARAAWREEGGSACQPFPPRKGETDVNQSGQKTAASRAASHRTRPTRKHQPNPEQGWVSSSCPEFNSNSQSSPTTFSSSFCRVWLTPRSDWLFTIKPLIKTDQ